jgi:hypothetical protein
MIILSLTTDKVSLITSSTAAIDVVTSYIDRDQSTGTVGLADRKLTAITTATTTDIVSVPAATTTRNVKAMHVRNKGAASNDVTIQFNANGTLYELFKTTLQGGECVEYVEGVGFFKTTLAGLLGRFDRTVYVTADSVHATAATLADITGLSIPVLNGVNYNFQAMLFHISNASTTGAQFACHLTTAPNLIIASTIDTVTGSVTASAHSAGSVTAVDTILTAQTTGSATITLAIISGFFNAGADDNFTMRATSEVTVASGLTVKKGSWLRVWQPTL